MKSSVPIDFKDSELPVCIRAPIFNIVVAVLFMAIPAIGCMGMSVYILLGNDPNKIWVFLMMSSAGLGLLVGSAFSISTQIELTPTAVVRKNFYQYKSLQISNIIGLKKKKTWNGWLLTIRTKDDYLLLGYLSFSTAQIESIERFINNRLTLHSSGTGYASPSI